MGRERLNIVNICCKKEREKWGNNVSPGLLLLAVLQGYPGIVSGTPDPSRGVMSLSGPLFVAKLEVRKHQALVTFC